MFNQHFAILTAKGFEAMSLDQKLPFNVPDLESPQVATNATRLKQQKPLGMFRLSGDEFFCCYKGNFCFIPVQDLKSVC